MTSFKNTLKFLTNKDPKLGQIILITKPRYKKEYKDEFTSLIKIIIGQQLSGAAAKTIIKRVEKCLKEKVFKPRNILNTSSKSLRLCGMSYSKIDYIKSFSEFLIENKNYFHNLKKNDDKEIIKQLCKIRGVGIWTASIFTMSTLNYENIFPYGDATLLKALKKIYGDDVVVENIISKWTPFKSAGCRILWQWVDKGMPRI